MEAFAEVSDLEDRWRPLSPDEQTRAKVLLMDASALLSAEFERCGRDPDLVSAHLKRQVSCYMVRRVMASGTGADLSQVGVTAGVFSEQRTFANPSGNLYVSADERRLLGIPKRRMRIESIGPWRGGGADDR